LGELGPQIGEDQNERKRKSEGNQKQHDSSVNGVEPKLKAFKTNYDYQSSPGKSNFF